MEVATGLKEPFPKACTSCASIWLFAAVFQGCHVGPPPREVLWDQTSPEGQRKELVLNAQSFIHARRLTVGKRKFPMDCSGFVGAVIFRNGIDIFGDADELEITGSGVKILYKYLSHHGKIFGQSQPKPGDLVFFSNTYDRNRNGLLDDPLTHVGIIEKVARDETITFIHVNRRGIRRSFMNLSFPLIHKRSDEKVLNSYLRRDNSKNRASWPSLAGALFAGFGSIVKDFAQKSVRNDHPTQS